ncbi:MAG: hypothetical protein QXQ30_02655 [Candidatus Pacearchaeota archaeon]
MEIKFGKYKGKSIDQIAFIDYGYFFWLKYLNDKNLIRDPILKEKINNIHYKLNNFLINVNCKGKDCNNKAKYMSLILCIDNGNVISISPSLDHVYCSENCFKNSKIPVREETMYRFVDLYKIGFDAYIKIKLKANGLGFYFPKHIYKKEFLPFMFKLLDFNAKKTKRNLEKLIDSINCL